MLTNKHANLLLMLLLNMCFCVNIYAQGITSQGDSLKVPADTLAASGKETKKEEITVQGFQRLENDITARVTAPRRDQNNEVCAIIKVVTKDKSLFFEPDALGIVARDDQPGEIWLYVPHGAKRITIKHELFGVVRNYFYPEPIDKSTVYELRLNIPKDEGIRIVEKQVTAQVLMMNYSPVDAKVFIDNEEQKVMNGAFVKELSLGEHSYRVERSHFAAESGTFNIVPEHSTALNVNLPARYGFLSIEANTDNTKLEINGEDKGLAPYKSDTLTIGKYMVKAKRKWYEPQEREIDLLPAEQRDVTFDMKREDPAIFVMPKIHFALTGSHTSYGIFAGICRKWGAYVNFVTDGSFALDDAAYTLGDGYLSGIQNYSGKTSKCRLAVTGGVMKRFNPYLYMYFGVGYSARKLYWERVNSEDNVAAVNLSSVAAEAGLIFHYKHIVASCGFLGHIAEESREGYANPGYRELSIGIGYKF